MNDLRKKFRFREFKVCNDGRKFCRELKELSKRKFPTLEQFSLTSRLWRALDSILLNIAEGAERETDKDFAHFLNSARTSFNEVAACLDVDFDNGYISKVSMRSALRKQQLWPIN